MIKETIPNFTLETKIINILYAKYITSTIPKMKEIYKLILEHTLLYCLNLEFHISRQGNTPRIVNFITLTLQGNNNVFDFRKNIFNTIFKLCDEDETNYKILLNNSNWFYNEEQKEILENDINYLDTNFFSSWNNLTIIQSKLLFLLKEKCQKFNIKIPISLEKYKESSEFIIINLFENYHYDENNDALLTYLENKNKDCYNTIFQVLKKVEDDNINVDNWKIYNSLDILFKYVLENNINLFHDIFNLYLEADCPFANGLFFIRNIIDKNILEDMLDCILKSSTQKKFYLLTCILNNYFNKKYIPIIKDFIKSQNNFKNKFTLSIEAVYEYSKFNNNLLENYTKDILTENDFNLYSSYTNSFVDKNIIDTLYSEFKNKKTLEKLYLNSIKCHADYEGNLGYLLCLKNIDFLNEILEQESYDNTGKVKNIVKKIWKNTNHKDIITHNYYKIIESNFGYLRTHRLFDVDNDEYIKNNQLEWFKSQILEFIDDGDSLYNLFYIISEKDDSFKKELIYFLLSNTNNIEIFKKISLFSHSESWTDSRVPIIENKIKFIQSILEIIKEMNQLNYICHIEYLNERINIYRDEIRKTQIKEYIDDFLD